jgi:hypothetical protein
MNLSEFNEEFLANAEAALREMKPDHAAIDFAAEFATVIAREFLVTGWLEPGTWEEAQDLIARLKERLKK